jgi:hypothetical protein
MQFLIMKLYLKKYLPENRKRKEINENFVAPRNGEYIINQALIWILIVFLSVIMVERFF